MLLRQSRNVIHLSITKKTVLRVVIYLPEEKLEWYNENQIHNTVLDALYSVILQHVIQDSGKQNGSKQKAETPDTLKMDGFRISYKFTKLNSKQTLLFCERDFVFADEEDTKPTLKTTYKGLLIYPFQLLVSVDDLVDDPNTIESYFKVAE